MGCGCWLVITYQEIGLLNSGGNIFKKSAAERLLEGQRTGELEGRRQRTSRHCGYHSYKEAAAAGVSL